MIRLVVNADDAGVDPARNRGILRAFQGGIVTSASLLAGFEAAEEFIDGARRAAGDAGRPLGIGLHLNLTEGKPLAAPARTLVGSDSRFLGKLGLWRRALRDELDPDDAGREIQAQLGWMADRGVEPDHLDGHQHVHLLPAAAEALAAAVPSGMWVRLPREGRSESDALSLDPEEIFGSLERLSGALTELSNRARRLWEFRFPFPARFLGLQQVGGYSTGDILDLLGPFLSDGPRRPAEIVELMVHPGEVDERSVPFSGRYAREREMEALTDPSVRRSLSAGGVELINFGALKWPE